MATPCSISINSQGKTDNSLESTKVPEPWSASEGSLQGIDTQIEDFQDFKRLILGGCDPNIQQGRRLFHSQGEEDTVTRSIESEQTFEKYYDQARVETNVDSSLQDNTDITTLRIMADQYQPSTDSVLTETRPRTLLSPVSGQSLREQVGHRRTISAANSTAQRANYEASQPFGSRSPSIIPEPMPSANNIPVGDSRLEPQPIDIPIQPHPTHLGLHPPLKPSKQPSQSSAYQVQVITELEPPRLEKDEYIVSLPLPSRVQDQYSRTVRYYQKSIQNILQAEIPEKSSMADTVKLLARLENISTHIDLENDTALSQSDVPLAEEANWAASCSAKFQFLRTLLNMMRHHDDSRVVVVAREGQLLDILERFLKAISVAFERLDSRDVMITEPNVRVILLPSGRLEGRITVFVDLIIAFDSSFDRYDTQVAAMRRRHPLKPDRACPIVYLLVYSSADHIQRCVPEMKSAMDKHKTVINCIVQTKSRVGVLEPGESRPDAAAEEVAAFVEAGGTEKNWTLPRIQVIKLQGLELMSASQSTGGYRPVENTSPIWRHRDTVRMLH